MSFQKHTNTDSLPLPGSDCWPWWTCHVCPWPRMHGTFTASCSLLWCQRSAILQAKSSKRTCRWSSYPRQPRAAASHDPLLFNGWVDLQWTRGWPLWTIWEFFLFLSVFWMGMNMIISGHVEKYLSFSLGLCWVLWSSLTQRLHRDPGFLDEHDRVRLSEILDLFTAFICQNIKDINNPSISGYFIV